MSHSIKAGWLIGIPLMLSILIAAGCSGGSPGLAPERNVSSTIYAQVYGGQGGSRTTVTMSCTVRLDSMELVFIDGTSESFALSGYSDGATSTGTRKLKYAQVFGKNGDYWYFDRSGTYLNNGAGDPKVSQPGDY